MNEATAEILRAHEPGGSVIHALNKLFEHDSVLLEIDSNERSITHRFAIYLQHAMPAWEVDCEYNRDGHDPKRVNLPLLRPGDDDTDATTVFPDVIAHHRNSQDNYLVIEFKKTSSRRGTEDDLDKLRAYKNDLGYVHALFILLGVGARTGDMFVEWIV